MKMIKITKPSFLSLPLRKGSSFFSKEIDVILVYPTSILKYSLSLGKTISFEKREDLTYQFFENQDLSQFIDKDTYIGVFEEELNIQKVLSPNLKNKKIIKKLILKESYRQLIPGEKYTIKYLTPDIKAQDKEFFVYAYQESKFYNRIKDESKYRRIKLYTFIHFALLPYNGNKDKVIHFYADKNHIYCIYSHNGVIEFVRTAILDTNSVESSLYENLTLTYNYIIRTFDVPDYILISGEILNYDNVIENFYTSSYTQIACINPDYYKINKDQINDLIIPVGLLNLSQDYNLMPENVIKSINFVKSIDILSTALSLVIAYLVFTNLNLAKQSLDNYFAIQNLTEDNKNLENRLESFLREKNIDYVSQILNLEEKRSNNISAVYTIEKLKNYLGLNYSSLELFYENGGVVCNVRYEKTFKTLTDLEKYCSSLLKDKDISVKIEKDLKQKKIIVRAKIEKQIN
ncbi:MAG: hypothetical protein JHC31_05915 [Sulfurihydrogenibium sp.]|jgi:hypothetical protein|nr:hypothetical protein [Sulfurihydrogenibium sp.]